MTETRRVLDPTHPADRVEWQRLWSASREQLPYAHPGVAGPLSVQQGRLLALTMSWQGSTVLYPLVLREIGDGLRDVTSPYGYGGPLVHGDAPRGELASRFWSFFEDWAQDYKVVSVFARLSLFDDVLTHPGSIRNRSINYVRELTPDVESLWSDSASKVRQNVRRARRSGLTVTISDDDSLLRDFERIYTATMERLESDSWYRFGHAFYSALHREYPGRLLYVAAEEDGLPVSIDLLLLGRDTAYYFLGGTDTEAMSSRPNDLVKMTVMEWLAEHGYRKYVLGGGVHPGDGLERYKKGFAPEGQQSFCTAEWILDPNTYGALTRARRAAALAGGADWDEDSDFFPAYRAPITGRPRVPALTNEGGA